MRFYKGTTTANLRELAALAHGSTVAMTFLQPIEFVEEADRPDSLRLSTGEDRLVAIA
jgi:hypothetical protein